MKHEPCQLDADFLSGSDGALADAPSASMNVLAGYPHPVKDMPPRDRLLELFEVDLEGGFLRFRSYRGGPAKPGSRAGTRTRAGYRVVTVDGRVFAVHRILWYLYSGEKPDVVDHINGVRDDNRIMNLRSVSRSENAKNNRLARLTRDIMAQKMTLAEAAKHMGLSVNGMRSRAKADPFRYGMTRDNSGRIWLEFDPISFGPGPRSSVDDPKVPKSTSVGSSEVSLEVENAVLRSRVELIEADRDQWRDLAKSLAARRWRFWPFSS